MRRTTGRPARTSHWEYRVVAIPRGVSRGEVLRRLTDDAEYGDWELARTRVYLGGARKVWLRRRVLRVEATF